MANREKLFFVMILLVLVFVIGALAYFVTTGTGGSDGIAPTGEGRSSDAAVRDIKTDIQTAGGIASEETPEKKLLVAGGGTAEENEPAGVTGNGRLTGLVVNEPGYALEGAKVHFVKTGESSFSRRLSLGLLDYKSPKNPWAATGPDGRFRLDNLPGGEKVSLFVDHEDHVVKKVTIGKYDGDRRDLGTIPLEGGGRITGRVKSREDGRPIAGALVKAVGLAGSMTSDNGFIAIFGGDAAPERVRKTETGPDGAFELKGIPEGNAVVSVEHDDFPPAESQKIHVKKGTTTTGVDLVLEKAYSISGTVLDADGKPIDGISVSVNQPVNVELSDLSSLSSSILKQAGSLSRPDGAFEITGIGEGTYKVTAKGKTYIPRSISGVETGTKDLVFTLQKGGIVFGRAFDSETGKGLEDFKLTVVNEGFLPFFTGLVLKGEEAAALIGAGADPRGAYYVEGVGNKPVELRFTAQGYADRTIKNITSSPGARESVDCVLEPEAAVAGVLLSPDGQPLSGGKLVLKKPEKHGPEGMVIKSILIEDGEEPVRMQGAHWRGRATSESSGKYRIRGVPEGDYVLEADHDNFRKPEPVELSLSAGESKSGIVMKMLAGGAVEGTVFGKDGRPMPGAAVRAKKVGGAPWSFEAESATADAGGKYAFKGLEPGEYSLSIASKESGSALVSIFVAGEEEKDSGSRVLVEENKTVELDLYDIPAGTVYGSVTEAGRGVPGIEVQIFSTEGFAFMPVKSCRTDDDGRYIMKEIKKGTYRVQLNLGGVPEPFEKEHVNRFLAHKRMCSPFHRVGWMGVKSRFSNSNLGEPAPFIPVTR